MKTTELWKFNKATERTEFTRKAITCEEDLLEVGWDPNGAADLHRFTEPARSNGDEGWQI